MKLPGTNKKHLYVKPSKNGWFEFRRDEYSVQLSGDTRKDGFWLEQFADKLGKKTFMQDFTDILYAISAENERLKKEGRYKDQIAIFSLYLPE